MESVLIGENRDDPRRDQAGKLSWEGLKPKFETYDYYVELSVELMFPSLTRLQTRERGILLLDCRT